MGKLNFTASFGEQLHCVSHNFTFAAAKTSLTEKRANIQDFLSCVLALSVCDMGLGLAHRVFDRSNAMLALSDIFQFLR